MIAIITGHIAIIQDRKIKQTWGDSPSSAFIGTCVGYFVFTCSVIGLITLVAFCRQGGPNNAQFQHPLVALLKINTKRPPVEPSVADPSKQKVSIPANDESVKSPISSAVATNAKTSDLNTTEQLPKQVLDARRDSVGLRANTPSVVSQGTVDLSIVSADGLVTPRGILSNRLTVTAMSFSNDAKWLFAGNNDGSITWHNLENQSQAITLKPSSGLLHISALDISFDGRKLLLGDITGKTAMMNIAVDGTLSDYELLCDNRSAVTTLIASPKFNFMATGAVNGSLDWLSIDQGAKARRTLDAVRMVKGIHQAMVTDGKTLIKFSLKSGEIAQSLNIGLLSARFVAFSLDGERFVASDGSKASEYNTATGDEIQQYKSSVNSSFWKVLYNPTKPLIFAGGSEEVCVFGNGKPSSLVTIPILENSIIRNFCISKDGRQLAVVPSKPRSDIYLFNISE